MSWWIPKKKDELYPGAKDELVDSEVCRKMSWVPE
jgi:hypothetical protein